MSLVQFAVCMGYVNKRELGQAAVIFKECPLFGGYSIEISLNEEQCNYLPYNFYSCPLLYSHTGTIKKGAMSL